MKRIIALALIAALCGFGGSAQAAKHWDDMSWWGNTGATPEPTADTKGRSGYWWWPKTPASNVDDGELWGNRGIVYHNWEKPAPVVETVTPPPVDPPNAPASRDKILLNHVLFDFDKSTLKPEGKAEIDKLVAEMQKYPGDSVVIVGHTCDIGTESYNQGLGQRRADSVATYMKAAGIDASRIQTNSMGESSPAVPNDSRSNRMLNRRAVFEITLGN